MDHFIPWSRYPCDSPFNLVLASKRENQRLRDALKPAAMRRRARRCLRSRSLWHRWARKRQLPCSDSHKGWTDESDPVIGKAGYRELDPQQLDALAVKYRIWFPKSEST